MSSPDLQAKANAQNARMEGAARIVIDDIERNQVRSIARTAFDCVVKCYDIAGTSGSQEVIDQCSRDCQAPYQMAHGVLQQVILRFVSSSNPNG